MASDYAAIRADNKRRYGTDIGRIGPMLLSDRYDDRTHFIYELLQNAEDALARRSGWTGNRSVRFQLATDELRVSHFGKPFDELDVRGICGIAESTKELTAIGRFGIGFKSVYAFTDRPCIHSGREHFAIESFVWPIEAPPIKRSKGETVIVIPLKSKDPADRAEITSGLQRLGARTLLFLRHVDQIEWAADGGPSGAYRRSETEIPSKTVRRLTLHGQVVGERDVEETWLVFSRSVATRGGRAVGYVEIAFLVVPDENLGRERVRPVSRSPLVAFFPTVLETHLGFLVQGPYRTTPSRDNVPRHNKWNRGCVRRTTLVLADALRWLRDEDLLDTHALRTLPLDGAKFTGDSMFQPLFRATKRLLRSEPLLPCFGGGFAPAKKAKLARTQELRELFDPARLAALLDADGELMWLTGDISQDRTPELRQYLMRELKIAELTPDALLARLTADFLEAQSDDWILRLYEFLNGQSALLHRALTLPLIRLMDGTHVPAQREGQPQAFLPSDIETGFPTVRGAVCGSDSARRFLASMGVTAPDPVVDVVWNVLPKYRRAKVDVSDDIYDSDIRRIVAAFASDSTSQREKLLAALRETTFVMALDTGDGHEYVSSPDQLYLATERLKELFSDIPGVLRVDDRHPCLRGEDVRELLEACGAVRHLRPTPTISYFDEDELRAMRVAAGCESISYWMSLEDSTLDGLDQLLAHLPNLDPQARAMRSQCLWDALADLESRRRATVFEGTYQWFYSRPRAATFDAAFVRKLNETEWVPDAGGNLNRPGAILFSSLGWKPNSFLLSKIHFKPPIIDQLAKEAGFEPGLLDLLKQRGITSTAQLRELLGAEGAPAEQNDEAGNVDDALRKLLGQAPAPTPPAPDPKKNEPGLATRNGNPARTGAAGGSTGERSNNADSHGGRQGEVRRREFGPAGSRGTPSSPTGRPFISYVAVRPDDKDGDPDGLDQSARMTLEARAIEFILEKEPDWQRTSAFTQGYDLFQEGPDGEPSRWCEVKAMTGSLDDRPVGLSRAQFGSAGKHGDRYWLYVVEKTGTSDARIVRIQDPAGRARTFTFDHGWLQIATVDGEQEDRED